MSCIQLVLNTGTGGVGAGGGGGGGGGWRWQSRISHKSVVHEKHSYSNYKIYAETFICLSNIMKIEDLTGVVISYEIMKRAFGEFHKFHMKGSRVYM